MADTAAVDPDLAIELAKATADAYAQATEELIAIVARQTRAGTDDPDGWAEKKLSQTRQLQTQANRVVRKLAGSTPGWVRTAITTAYDAGHDASFVRTHTRAVDALVQEAVTKLESTYGQILRSLTDDYRQIITKTSLLVNTGAFTVDQAVNRTLDDFAKKGITGFVDTAGRRWRLDRYAEMAVRTATGRAHVAGTLAEIQSHGGDLVIVSNHFGTCPVCAPWESKILSITGAGFPHTVKDGDGKRHVVAGSVAEAQAAGLQHPNCRHAITRFVVGLSAPPKPVPSPTDGKERRLKQHAAAESERLSRRRKAARTGKAPRPKASTGSGGGKGRPPKQPTPANSDEGDGRRGAKPGAAGVAKYLHARVRALEPGVTADIQEVASAVGGDVERLDTKFKAIRSLTRKLSDMDDISGRVLRSHADQINDALRYTVVFGDSDYAAGVDHISEDLAARGYGIGRRTNRWKRIRYRGVNITVTEPSGEKFELQLHTRASLKASDDTHEWYEEERDRNTSPTRKKELRRMINEVYSRVPVPPGIELVS